MSKPVLFTGVGTAIITPMQEDGSVYYHLLCELIERQLEAGVAAIVAVGTTGEAATLTPDEWAGVVTATVEQVRGRVPVIVGVGSNCTAEAVRRCRAAEENGADAVLAVTPYYNKTSQQGLIEHYTHIADRCSLPLILYNVPSRTGINLLPETVIALSAHPRIAGIKEASGDLSAAARIASGCDLPIYAGNDDQTVPFLSLGGKGVISVIANLVPRQTVAMVRRWFDGDAAQSRLLQLEWLDLCRALFSDVNPMPVKAAMRMMGWEVGKCRLPLTEPSPSAVAALRQSLQNHRLM